MSNSHQSCPLCDSTQIQALPEYNRAFLNKCSSCNFIFSKTIPSNEELEDYYSSEYELTEFFSPITAKRYEQILDGFEHLKKTGNLLDVGTGSAFFAEIAIKKGWKVFGTELTDETIQAAEKKGINMSKGKLEDVQFETDFFDLVICIEVIEHVSYPVPFVNEIQRILRKGGAAYVSTPNFDSYLRRKLKGQYDVIGYPNHLSYFTAKTLKSIFTKSGFNKKSLVTSGISRTRLKTSTGKSNQAFVSETSDDEILRHRIEKKWYLRAMKNVANWFLNLFNLGDSIKATFIKN
ncbi:MAG: class I SAM-dependent methyltransferase [Crocinitomicaceae bacterium]|nr:class I SAM-dependent methyltransferase [Crocinitomicaceae bacterium]